MARASTSHGNQDCWDPRNFALKNPATHSFPPRVMYNVAPIPGFRTAPSVTSHNWSSGLGSVMVRVDVSDFCARWNADCSWSDQVMDS